MTKLEPNKQNGLEKASAADAFQIRSVSQARFVKRIGALQEVKMEKIRKGLSQVLSIETG